LKRELKRLEDGSLRRAIASKASRRKGALYQVMFSESYNILSPFLERRKV
jgi:hypothetical protein